jgi:protein-S-isoprenylcysteine O-methyltransferase Ste14
VGHNLVTSGPYARVRHPIYTAMLLLLIGTGLAMSSLPRLVVALIVFAIGTTQRVRIEEQLLENSHGEEFRAYRERVPAVVPRLQ